MRAKISPPVFRRARQAFANLRALVRQDVADLVKGSFLEGAAVIEVSAITGDGLERLREAIASEAAGAERRPADGAARLSDRARHHR